MKVTQEQAAKNRELVVEAAGRLVREKGVDGTSVAEIMNAAKLTHGGFYGQFKSKADLVEEACERGLSRGVAFWNRLANESKDPLQDVIDSYLSMDHVKSPGRGCFFAALACDVSRQDRGLRRVFTSGFRASIDALARIVKGNNSAARRREAIAVISQLVGAMVLARSIDDETLSREITEANEADIEKRRR
jgi:TetR/AcrR family transcriptional repressor of nem operon